MTSSERLTILISFAALILSGVTAWFQFSPKYDNIEIVSQNVSEMQLPIAARKSSLPLPKSSQPESQIGPVAWDVMFYNPNDRPVSIVGVEAFYEHPDGKIGGNDILLGIQSATIGKGRGTQLPIIIEAYTTKLFRAYFNVPIKSSPDVSCNKITSLKDLSKCYAKEAQIDLFGNPVNYQEFQGGGLVISWPDGNPSPRFSVIMKTATGEEFSFPLAYYPFSVATRSTSS